MERGLPDSPPSPLPLSIPFSVPERCPGSRGSPRIYLEGTAAGRMGFKSDRPFTHLLMNLLNRCLLCSYDVPGSGCAGHERDTGELKSSIQPGGGEIKRVATLITVCFQTEVLKITKELDVD